tara:strand:- start:683 stop:1147 length:465 start_codon:yes stop_codon:yes gene_type:complete
MEPEFKIEILSNKNPEENIPDKFKDVILKIKELSEHVFKELGTGFSEYIYHKALEVALRDAYIVYESKRIIPINYKNINVGYGESDLIVHYNEELIVVELKAVTNPPREIEIAQVRTYLNSVQKSVIGIIINFPQPGTKISRENIDFKVVHKNK